MRDAAAVAPILRKLEFGAVLNDGDKQAVVDMIADVRRFPANSDIIGEGERPEFVHAVLAGFAYRYKMVPDGGRQIMAWLVPGDFCDLHVFVLGQMDHAIAAITDCRVAMVPRDAMERATTSRGALNRAFWWSTLVDEAVLREWMVGMGRRAADKQIAHIFCELHQRLRSVGLISDGVFEFPLTQEDLADSVGMSAVHINRVLQHLRAEGLISLERQRLTILDVDRLRRFADFDPSYLHLVKRVGNGDPG